MTQPQTNEQLARSLGQVSNDLRQVQASLSAGELSLEPGVGKALQDGLAEALKGHAQVKRLIPSISMPAQLGSNSVSTSMTNKFASRADGGALALGPLLEEYGNLLAQTRDAVATAMFAYNSGDEGISQDLSGN